VLQIHVDIGDAATASGAGRAFIVLRVVLALIAPALISGWLFVFLLTVQSVSLLLLLVGPGTELIAVTVVSTAFHVVTRRCQLAA
jgi:iron(III) transport system permease protein